MMSGSAGNRLNSSRASLIASSHSGAPHVSIAAARGIALVEHEIEHRGHRGEPLGAFDGPRGFESTSAVATRALARVMRCSMALSLTRKARAISFTVNPDTTRNASAICCTAGRSGWQQMNSRRNTSSR